MKKFAVSDPGKMSAILNTFSQLDDVRWNAADNYNLINYCRDDLTDDEKLLTHWLCYITDRQMAFERIWDIGGYVLSSLVHNYTSCRQKDVRTVLQDHFEILEDGKLFFKAPLKEPNRVLSRYGITGETVNFASRYIPEDLTLIYRTLEILDKLANRSLVRFMNLAFADKLSCEEEIRRLAQILNQLTYKGAGAISARDLDQRLNEVEQDIKMFKVDLNSEEKLFSRKRLWCSLRDYLKSPAFNTFFVYAMRNIGYRHAKKWDRNSHDLKKALKELELPGDVWNNVEIFRKGLFAPYIVNERKSWDMPKTVRKIYECILKTEKTCFYPEQLDVTFDFVPRMCERSMCAVCLFGGGIKDICHQNENLLCPVVLYSCGYTHRCNPINCNFKEDPVKGLCKSSSMGSLKINRRRQVKNSREQFLINAFIGWWAKVTREQFQVISNPDPPEAIVRSDNRTTWIEVTDVYYSEEWARDLHSYATHGEEHKPMEQKVHTDMDAKTAEEFVKVLKQKLSKKSYEEFSSKYGPGILLVGMLSPWFNGETCEFMREECRKTDWSENRGYFSNIYISCQSLDKQTFEEWKVTNKPS